MGKNGRFKSFQSTVSDSIWHKRCFIASVEHLILPDEYFSNHCEKCVGFNEMSCTCIKLTASGRDIIIFYLITSPSLSSAFSSSHTGRTILSAHFFHFWSDEERWSFSFRVTFKRVRFVCFYCFGGSRGFYLNFRSYVVISALFTFRSVVCLALCFEQKSGNSE